MVKQTTKGRKSRSAARFGPRYGRKSRKLVGDLEEKTKALYDCPSVEGRRFTEKGQPSGAVANAATPLQAAHSSPRHL